MGNLDGDTRQKHKLQHQSESQHDRLADEQHAVYATPSKTRSTPTRDSRKHVATPTRTPTPTPTRYNTYSGTSGEGTEGVREDGQISRRNGTDNSLGVEKGEEEYVDGRREREEVHHNRYGTPPTRRHPILHPHAPHVPVSVSPAAPAQHAPSSFSSPSPSRNLPRSQSASRAQSLAMQILSKPITPYQTPVKGNNFSVTPRKSPGSSVIARSPAVKNTGAPPTSAPSSHAKTPQARHSRAIGTESPQRTKSVPTPSTLPLPLTLPSPDLHPPPPPSLPYSAIRMNVSTPFPFTPPRPTAAPAKCSGDLIEKNDMTYSTPIAYVQVGCSHQEGVADRHPHSHCVGQHVGQADSTRGQGSVQSEVRSTPVPVKEGRRNKSSSSLMLVSDTADLQTPTALPSSASTGTGKVRAAPTVQSHGRSFSSSSSTSSASFVEADSAFMSLSGIASPSGDMDRSQSTSTWGMGMGLGLGPSLGLDAGVDVGSGEETV